MACTEQRSLAIGELAGGRLLAPAVDELLDHVEGCEACSGELDVVASLVAASAEDGAGAEPGIRRLPGSSWSWGRWAALAAGVLFLLFARSLWLGEEGSSGVEALAVLSPLPAPPATLRGGAQDPHARFSSAMERYRAGDFARAAEELDAAIAAGDGRALAQLYLGIARLQTGELDAADAALLRVEALDDGLLRERARWYRANLFLCRGEPALARDVLASIVQGGGEYELNARELLGRLDAIGAD